MTQYAIIRFNFFSGTDDLEIRQTTALTTVITGLRKFTNYSLQILSFTKIGDGAVSTVAHCQTEEDGKY